jgi:hypothetical protein
MLKRLRQLALTAVLLGSASGANAGLIFIVDASASSATITSLADGFICTLTSCGVSVSLAPGLHGTTFELNEGESFSFDFLTFVGDGTGGAIYEVAATLAFSQPAGANTTGSGLGAALLVAGQIIGGALLWTNLPAEIVLPEGSTVGIDFEDGIALLQGHSVTTGASVNGVAIAIPTTGTLSLLGIGLVALGAVRRYCAVSS